MNETVVHFDCQGDRLIGILHQPTSAQKKIGVIIVVGGPQYRVGSHRQFTLMARTLATAGFPTLRFDYRGMGDSQGDFQGFEKIDEDIKSAIDVLFENISGLNGVILWGLCDAASACLIYANRKDPRVTGLVVANPWVRTCSGEAKTYLKYYYIRRLIQKNFWKKLIFEGFYFKKSILEFLKVIKKIYVINNDSSKEETYINKILSGLELTEFPILMIFSQNDLVAREFIALSVSNACWSATLNSKRINKIYVENADHTFSSGRSMEITNKCCIDWLDSNLC